MTIWLIFIGVFLLVLGIMTFTTTTSSLMRDKTFYAQYRSGCYFIIALSVLTLLLGTSVFIMGIETFMNEIADVASREAVQEYLDRGTQ